MNTNNFIAVFGVDVETTEGNLQFIVSKSGTISQLRASRNAAPNNNQAVLITVRKNGVDTALKCEISNPARTSAGTGPAGASGPFDAANTTTSCQNVADSVTFSAGDLMSVQVQQDGSIATPGGSPTRWGGQFSPSP